MFDHNHWRHWRFARNQVECGMAHLPWAARVRPLRPLWMDAAYIIVALVAATLLTVSYLT